MNPQRVMTWIGAVAVAASAVAIVINFTQDPFKANRDALEQKLDEIGPAPEDTGAVFNADGEKWKKTVEARPALWDSLTPKAAAAAKPVNVAAALKGVRILPGSSGNRVRLATPENPRGQMFNVGDTVRPNVTIQAADNSKVTFKITQGTQTAEHTMKRK